MERPQWQRDANLEKKRALNSFKLNFQAELIRDFHKNNCASICVRRYCVVKGFFSHPIACYKQASSSLSRFSSASRRAKKRSPRSLSCHVSERAS